MNEEEFLNRLLNKIDKEFGYDAASTLKLIVMTKDKQVEQLNKEYERIYNENCKLREEHNITDIKLLDENNRLKNIIDELEEIINYEIQEWKDTDDELMKARVQEDKHILEVIEELKENK